MKIEVIAGPMSAGKTEELLRRLRRAQIAKQDILVFKPRIDDRYEPNLACSHAGGRWDAEPVGVSDSDLPWIERRGLHSTVHVIGLEEAQFFPPGIVDVVQRWRASGKRVICTCLDMDSSGKPFGPAPALLAIGEVTKLTAVCTSCGAEATHTYRRSQLPSGQVLVGGLESYTARCYPCWSLKVE